MLILSFWLPLIRNAQAVIFVLDSSDRLRIAVAREELELLLKHSGMICQDKVNYIYVVVYSGQAFIL